MRNHSYDLNQPIDSFHDNQTHFYMKGFTQRLGLKQRHKNTFIHELLTRAFDYLQQHFIFAAAFKAITESFFIVQRVLFLKKNI